MVKLAITADDFTGALDTAVQFSSGSIQTAVMFYNDLDFSGINEEVRVVVVDTESRHISAGEAADRVRAVTARALEAGVTHFYKKTDSVLRGNVGSELLAMIEASGSRELMFVPAYPDMGRTTAGGSQYLNGIPLKETSFARDPIDPITESSIPKIIKRQADTNVVIIGRIEAQSRTIGDQPDNLAAAGDHLGNLAVKDSLPDNLAVGDQPDNSAISDQPDNPAVKDSLPGMPNQTGNCCPAAGSETGRTIYVFDAENNQDLFNIADLLKSTGKLKLTAGCAGFAGMLTEALGLAGTAENARSSAGTLKFPAVRGKVRMLTICGSINDISLRQVSYAVEKGFCRIMPEPYQLLTPGYFETEAGRDFIDDTVSLINDGYDIILTASAGGEDRESYSRAAREMKLDENGITDIIPRAIAVLARKIADKARPGVLTVVGGDTAFAVTGSMGFHTVVPKCEIEKGVVLSEAFGYDGRIGLVTKSGGFGKEDILVKVRDYMRKQV